MFHGRRPIYSGRGGGLFSERGGYSWVPFSAASSRSDSATSNSVDPMVMTSPSRSRRGVCTSMVSPLPRRGQRGERGRERRVPIELRPIGAVEIDQKDLSVAELNLWKPTERGLGWEKKICWVPWRGWWRSLCLCTDSRPSLGTIFQ